MEKWGRDRSLRRPSPSRLGTTQRGVEGFLVGQVVRRLVGDGPGKLLRRRRGGEHGGDQAGDPGHSSGGGEQVLGRDQVVVPDRDGGEDER